MSNYNYNPDAFNPADSQQARSLCLPSERGAPTDFRWEKETPGMVETVLRELEAKHGELILDYGCGIGRLAKELCARGAQVIGVDISPAMRRMAMDYVAAPGQFLVASPEEFDLLCAHGLRVDSAFAVWVLQHCLNPEADIMRIFNAVKPQGKLMIANSRFERAVPVKEAPGWIHDGVDVWAILDRYFGLQRTTPLPRGIGIDPDQFSCRSYMKTFSRV